MYHLKPTTVCNLSRSRMTLRELQQSVFWIDTWSTYTVRCSVQVPAIWWFLSYSCRVIGQPCQPGSASLLQLGDALVSQDADHELTVFVNAGGNVLDVGHNASISGFKPMTFELWSQSCIKIRGTSRTWMQSGSGSDSMECCASSRSKRALSHRSVRLSRLWEETGIYQPSIHPYIDLSIIYQSIDYIYPFIHLSVHSSLYLSSILLIKSVMSIYPIIYAYIHLTIYTSVDQSIIYLVHQTYYLSSLYLSIYISIYSNAFARAYLSYCLSKSINLWLLIKDFKSTLLNPSKFI